MRIVTRPDFDGIVCAVLLKEFLPETRNEAIAWIEPGTIQRGGADIRHGDILANLPYDSRCSMWFDHHVTNRIETPFSGAFSIAPSAARVIYDHFDTGQKEKHRELVIQADKVDSADLTEEEVIRPESNPFVLLSMTVNGRHEEDEPYWNRLVTQLGACSMDRVMEDPDVAKRCQTVVAQNALYKDQLIRNTRMEGPVAVTDFRSFESAPEGNRFLAYSLFRDAVVSVKIRHDQKDRTYVIVSVGHSIFNRNCTVNAGELLSRYSGGGHFGAAACRFHQDMSETFIAEIIDILRRNEPL